jgi:hypothetical protein
MNNFTTNQYKFEEHEFTIVDVIITIFGLMILGKFLEGFEEYLRMPRNNNDNDDVNYDIVDFMVFFD